MNKWNCLNQWFLTGSVRIPTVETRNSQEAQALACSATCKLFKQGTVSSNLLSWSHGWLETKDNFL